ncbi:SusC/RagA family TonB-linked outer membrane protein [Anaerorudis cellulosivorans]|uniref:SusC/RagA family TonB-linked outer membrane protein n=1 Tax=Anaerorudis cellulosivorans TaxID=3397862 RepID=UPI00221E5250|nr:TonB-dependent receptor [Seramator thermalis]MCW1734524.1 TonB-dependent receptor [Seramator thermalis]
MKRKLMMFLTLFILGIGWVSAQVSSISGKVISAEDGLPVIGATIIVKGTSIGTVTDIDGNFTLNLPSDANTLVISYVGKETVEVTAKNGMIVELFDSVSQLDEVIITAFGTTTKKSFTGSASVIKEDDIIKRQTSNITNALVGQVAGIQGLSSNGQPGTGASIRIRGIGSINASNAPLYIVDGIPYDSDISALNNADIESITILKDAASNALYGARGANGVIIITTKRGKSREALVTVDAKWGNNSRAVPSYDVMTDAGMYYETFYRALYNSKISSGVTAAHEYANKNLLDVSQGGLGYLVYTVPKNERLVGTNFKLNPNASLGYSDGKFTYLPDDWYDELFKANNLRQEYNVNVSGALDKLSYYASIGKLDDTGIIENSNFSRFSTRANIDYQIKNWLKIGSNLSFVQTKSKYPSEQTTTNSSGNLFFLSSNIAPIYPLYIRDASGNIMRDNNGFIMYDYGDGKVIPSKRPFMSQSNPASAIALNKEFYLTDYFIGKWYAIADLYEGLKFTINYGLTNSNQKYQYTLNPFYGQFAAMGGAAGVSQSRFTSTNQQYLLTYQNRFDLNNVDLLLGYESYELKDSHLSGYKQKLFQPFIPEISNAILQPSTSSDTDTYATMGVLFQAKYDYDSKYFGSASYRRDASSCFAPENRWGNFWSLGAAWDINREDFMSADFIDLLKLKVSYGAQGNDKLYYPDTEDINYYPYIDQYDVTETNGEFATARSYKGNNNITWETSYNFNMGVDFSMFNQRFNGTLEAFSRRTDDMLYYKPMPGSSGYTESPMNIGSVKNSGFETDLHMDVIKSHSLIWNVYVNATFLRNRIISLDESLKGQWIDGNYIYKEGSSMYNFYLREFAGVDPETGASLWYKDIKDENGNVTGQEKVTNWSTATQYELGDILPDVYGGFGTSLNYSGFDFSVAFAYQLGGKIYDDTYANIMHSGYSSDAGRNWHKDILKAWTPENPDTDVPRVNSNDQYTNYMSDRFIISSDFLSLQNITLGYTFPSKLLNHFNINKLRIYCVADNVALLSARKGLDPRQSFTTSNAELYTPIRSISGGINITF